MQLGKRKKQCWRNGDLFSIELKDGRHVLAQVLSSEPDAMGSVVCGFSLKFIANDEKPTALPLEQMVSIQFTTPELLDSGAWPVVGHTKPPEFTKYLDVEAFRKKRFVGISIKGAGNIQALLDACFGLEPWDFYYDPLYFDKLLVSASKKPACVIYKSELERPN